MKKVLSTIVIILTSLFFSLPAFAKGGGFGALMAERSKLLYEEGYRVGYMAGLVDAITAYVSSTTVALTVLLALPIGAAVGYIIGKKRKS